MTIPASVLPHGFLSALLYLSSATVAWLVTIVLYRRFFHPLAKIPGPFLAAITHFYIAYFNLFNGKSQFYLQVEKLHQKYGPIIRISPNEIHLSQPENYEKIYYIGSKAPSKAAYFYSSLGAKTAAFTTTSNELHRVRRGALNPLFSKKAVLQLEDLVQSKAEKLLCSANQKLAQGESVDLYHGFRALSVDIITDCAFDNCYNQLDTPDFAAGYFNMIRQLVPTRWFMQAFPILQPIPYLITPNIAKKINIHLYKFLDFKQRCATEIASMKQKIDQGGEKLTQKTIFHQLLDPSAIEGRVVRNVEDLTDEAFALISAASNTTGHAMTITSYYVISNPQIYDTLTAELEMAFPNPTTKLDYATLEKLPYLTAVIKEGLRLSYGAPGRLPRMIETDEILLNGYSIPRGTIVGMSAWMMHRNPKIFPDPESFLPDRWLGPANMGKLEKYLVPFGKGSRQCLGMHLAYCEIYITLGTLFRRFKQLRVDGMTPADLEFEDWLAPYPLKDSRLFHVAGQA